MPQPALMSDRLLLVPLVPEHLDLEAKLDFDAEVMRYLGGPAQSMAEGRAGAPAGMDGAQGRGPGILDGPRECGFRW